MKLTFGIDKYGTKTWRLNGELHNLNGPARVWEDGSEEYWINGDFHRIDGPAILACDGYKEYWINGVYYTETEFFIKTGCV